jgi:hypothetical protein
MDTENFILARAGLVAELQKRRSRDPETYSFRMFQGYGINLPSWAKLGLSFMTREGAIMRLMELGLPLALPFLYRRKMPFVERLFHRIFSPKA